MHKQLIKNRNKHTRKKCAKAQKIRTAQFIKGPHKPNKTKFIKLFQKFMAAWNLKQIEKEKQWMVGQPYLIWGMKTPKDNFTQMKKPCFRICACKARNQSQNLSNYDWGKNKGYKSLTRIHIFKLKWLSQR